MTDHLNVDNSFVQAIVENAAWDAARVSLIEADKKGDKSKDKPGDKPDFTTDARKGDKTDDKKKKGDKPDFTTGARKGDDGEDGEKDFEGTESVEEHVCPLCESHLDEALTDEKISEHVGQIQDALLAIEEGGEGPASEEPDEEPTDADLGKPDALEAKKKKNPSRKEAVMTKVKELKKAASGK